MDDRRTGTFRRQDANDRYERISAAMRDMLDANRVGGEVLFLRLEVGEESFHLECSSHRRDIPPGEYVLIN